MGDVSLLPWPAVRSRPWAFTMGMTPAVLSVVLLRARHVLPSEGAHKLPHLLNSGPGTVADPELANNWTAVGVMGWQANTGKLPNHRATSEGPISTPPWGLIVLLPNITARKKL